MNCPNAGSAPIQVSPFSPLSGFAIGGEVGRVLIYVNVFAFILWDISLQELPIQFLSQGDDERGIFQKTDKELWSLSIFHLHSDQQPKPIKLENMTMKRKSLLKASLLGTLAVVALFMATPDNASAHCDTLDGPVIQDARKAIGAQDITPILKWVKPKDEKAVQAAFQKVLDDKSKSPEVAEHKFFETLVKVHRAGEGAPYTGLKPAGAVEPAVAEADRALASGSADPLVQLITADVAAGIKTRFEHAAATYQHKDESVAQGREFVEAYVVFTHYVERLHQDAIGKSAHGEAGAHDKHDNKEADHSKH